MGARAFHFPEGDVVVPVARLVGLGGNRFREHDEKSSPIRLGDPVKVFRCRPGSAANTSEHEDHRWMGREICGPMNDVGPAVSVMCEGPDRGLRWGIRSKSYQKRDEEKKQYDLSGWRFFSNHGVMCTSLQTHEPT